MSDAMLDKCLEILDGEPERQSRHYGLEVAVKAILESSTDRPLPVGIVVLRVQGEEDFSGWWMRIDEWEAILSGDLDPAPWIPSIGHYRREPIAHFPPEYSRWRHYKGGTYRVIGHAFAPPYADEPLVIYAPTDGMPLYWARPLVSWSDVVAAGEGDRPVRRFELIPEAESEAAPPDSDSAPAPPPATPEVWAVVEKMGHVSMAGRLTEEAKFGGNLGRIDVPQPDGSFATHYFGSQSVYGVTIVTEATARKKAEESWPRPVQPYESRAISARRDLDEEYDLRDDDDDRDDDGF